MTDRPASLHPAETEFRAGKEFRVGPRLLDRLSAGRPDWQDHALGVGRGAVRFRTARPGPGLTLTTSSCRLEADYRSHIDHGGAVGVLAFGLSGTSLFGCGHPYLTHKVQAGDVWLFRLDDAPITRLTPAQDQASMLAVKFDLDRIATALAEAGIARQGTGARRLGRLDDRSPLSALTGNPLASALDRLRAESAALGLLADWLGPGHAPEPPNGLLAPEDRRAVARVADRLLADMAEPPSLDELAALAGMSHVRLNRCFRKAYGATVFAWLRDRRLDQARRALERGEASVTEIAFLCGFSSSSHFAAAFRARHGTSPAAFRRG
ncbi:helix-turn-helix transcriptional regulator [uncultured Tistrella sp.]|uniref:helix-turn-helix transcriptional regulator n=1 Tax=Tistrella mobilis TaxID=171437 RepID=UPI000C0BA5D8|nr:AraC family transcriptional regulator [uncultured Tistrella sp.]MAM72324.1 AraC family transcriptional regulator [Tistrella sp.]